MKIAIAQINCTVGDLAGNAARIIDFAQRARAEAADVLLTPELALCGYPPEDLLLRDDFYHSCDSALRQLAAQIKGITAVVGHPHQDGRQRYNAASIIQDSRIVATYHKHALPNYTVFDEERYFESDDKPCVFQIKGKTLGVNICEDTWDPFAPRAARAAGAQILLVLNASPYHLRKQHTRYDVMRERVAENGIPLIYANMVGGQDELVFDGHSFVVAPDGTVIARAAQFEEELLICDIPSPTPGYLAEPLPDLAEVYAALKLGLRDYVLKNGFRHVGVALSGGIDSALVALVAVDALGAESVTCVSMPSPHSSAATQADARAIAENLGVELVEISIETAMDEYERALSPAFGTGRDGDAADGSLPRDPTRPHEPDLAAENIQARIRGNLMMALSNKHGWLVLTTGNKSEIGVGYSTLYGDMAGGFAVIKDVPKTLVYQLAEHANRRAGREVIPRTIFDRPPTAELRPGQTDQDTLPPYAELDAILEAYVEGDQGAADITARGFDEATVRRVIAMVDRNEYKRRQGPIGIKITPRAFGRDWRLPIVNRFRA